MSEEICAGDLVCIVGTLPCGCDGSIGVIFRVTHLESRPGNICVRCWRSFTRDVIAAGGYQNFLVAIRRLKKIDAPSIAGDVETREELHA